MRKLDFRIAPSSSSLNKIEMLFFLVREEHYAELFRLVLDEFKWDNLLSQSYDKPETECQVDVISQFHL